MKLKFDWKSRRVIASFITVLLMGFGVANEELIVPVGTAVLCSAVRCDA